MSLLTPTDQFPLPARGRFRYYVITDRGVLTAEAPEEELVHNRHPLSPLFCEGDHVLTAIREHSEKIQRPGR